MTTDYANPGPDRAEVDALSGPTVVEFGTQWCGYCRSVQPAITAALAAHPEVRHIKVEDRSGRPLGRSFHIKLWPTLIFMKDGQEVTRLVRPGDGASIANALTQIN